MAVDRKKTFSDKEMQDRLAAELPKWRLRGRLDPPQLQDQ